MTNFLTRLFRPATAARQPRRAGLSVEALESRFAPVANIAGHALHSILTSSMRAGSRSGWPGGRRATWAARRSSSQPSSNSASQASSCNRSAGANP
jgi:hypothetical protein